MDQATQQVLEKYSKLFLLTFSASSDQERSQAENELQESGNNDPNFMKHILSLIELENTPHGIKQAASVYISTFTRLFATTDKFSNEDVAKAQVEILYEAILSQNIKLTYKTPLCSAITLILQFDVQNKIKTVLFESIVKILSTQNHPQTVGSLLILQAIISSTRQSNLIEPMIQNIIQPFCDTALVVLEPLVKTFINLAQQNQVPDENAKKDIKIAFETLDTWVSTLSNLITKITDFESEKSKLQIKQLVYTNKLGLVLMTINQLLFPNSQQLNSCFISSCGIEEIDESINDLKGKMLRQYTKINSYVFANQGKVDYKQGTLYQMLLKVIPSIIGTVYNFCIKAQDKLFDVLENTQLSKLVVEYLLFLKTCGSQTDFYHFYAESKKQLILNVLFPMMRTSPLEAEQFEQAPDEFVHLALDTCDKQFSETYKTASSQLLEILCDNIDGSISLVGYLSISIIKFSLNSLYNPTQPEVLQNNPQFQHLNDTYETIFMKHSKPETRIETCLLALSVMSYLIPKRADLVNEIEQIIIQNHQFLLSTQSEQYILKSRVCLFLGYFSDTIFQAKGQEQQFQQCIEFLVQCTSLVGQDGVSIQAIDSLINVYDDDQPQDSHNQTILPIFQHLIKQIQTQQSTQFLDLIQTITSQFQQQLSTQLNIILECIKQLVERVKIEFKLLQNKERTTQLFINKCWNIIRAIADNDHYILNIINEMEELLAPLMEALSQPDQIEFDDDILLTITSIIKKSKSITQHTSKLFQFFPKVYEKYGGMLGHMSQTINCIVEYGEQFFAQNNQFTNDTLKMIIKLCIDSIKATGKRVNEADNSEGATLLQALTYKYHSLFSDEVWLSIFQETIQRIKDIPIQHNFLKGRILGIFLIGFLVNHQKTQQILAQQGMLQLIMETILAKAESYGTNYDVKVFVLSMSQFILADGINQEIRDCLPKILDFLVTLLKKQQVQELKKQNKSNNAAQDSSDDDDYYSDDDEDDYRQFASDEITQDKLTLEYFICPLKTEDEFQFFKDKITQLKNINQESLLQFLNTLPQDKKDFLQEVLSVKRIAVGEKTIARRIVRRKKQ